MQLTLPCPGLGSLQTYLSKIRYSLWESSKDDSCEHASNNRGRKSPNDETGLRCLETLVDPSLEHGIREPLSATSSVLLVLERFRFDELATSTSNAQGSFEVFVDGSFLVSRVLRSPKYKVW